MFEDDAKGGRGQCKYCGEFHNNVALHEALECEKAIRPWVKLDDGTWVQGAPQWLKDRMEKLRQQPPPTIEEVREQWETSIEQQRYMDVEDIRKAKVIR